MRANPFVVSVIIAGLAMVVWPSTASACSCDPRVLSRSNVQDGAVDIPRNQALIVEGFLDPSSISLERASGGRVEFELRQGPWPACPGTWAELVPKQPLDAWTTYTLRVQPAVGDRAQAVGPAAISFTTGSSLLAEQTLAPPTGDVSIVTGVPDDGASCGPTRVQACVGLSDADDIEIIATKAEQVILRWTMPSEEGNFGLEVVPDCIEFRRRSQTGARSEPLRFCGRARNVREFRKSDVDERGVLRCKAGVIGSEGCAMRPHAGRSGGMLLICAVALVSTLLRRRARSNSLFARDESASRR